MTPNEIVRALEAGGTLYLTSRASPIEEATLGALYERGLLEVERVSLYGRPALAVRLRRRRFVRVRVVRPTWYGARVYETLVEV